MPVLGLVDNYCGLSRAGRLEHCGLAKRGRDFTFMARYLFCPLFLFSSLCFAGLNEDIKINIEEPVGGGVYSGISNLRGWAIAPEGINRFLLSVYVDGEFAFYMVPYGQRTDVGNAYPDYLGSETGGFSMAFNYKDLTPGEHEIRVLAFDDNEDYNEAVTTFTTERFVGSFISDDSEVDISTSETWSIVDNQTYLITGPTIEGEQWDFELKWDKASQGFKIQRIALSGSDNSSDSSGGGDGTGGNSGSETASCADLSGTWSGRLEGEVVLTGGGQTYRDYTSGQRTLYVRQSGCSITFTQSDPNISALSGTISGTKAVLSGSPYSFSTFNRELKAFLSREGISAEPSVQSITFAGDATLSRDQAQPPPYDNYLYVRFVINARGTARTSQGTVSFEYSYSGTGYFYQ